MMILICYKEQHDQVFRLDFKEKLCNNIKSVNFTELNADCAFRQ